MDNKLIIYVLGHKEEHKSIPEPLVPIISNSEEINDHTVTPGGYGLNQYISEYSGILKILENGTYTKYDYVGIFQYSCIYSDTMSNLYDFILTELGNCNGIISKSFEDHISNRLARSRWMGSSSLDYCLSLVENRSDFMDYLNSSDKSYRSLSVLPSEDFKKIYTRVTNKIPDLLTIRESKGTLHPRSVGYDLEILLSYELIKYYNSSKNIKRLNYNIIK